MELLELDDFYAGIATSVIAGNSPPILPKRDELDSLRAWLEKLRVAILTPPLVGPRQLLPWKTTVFRDTGATSDEPVE